MPCPYLQSDEVKELFTKYGVLSERELESRLEIYLEQYCKTINVEGESDGIEMAKTMIFPAAIRYQNELASTCANLKLLGYEFDTDTLDTVTALVKLLQDSIADLEAAMAEARFGRPDGRSPTLLRQRAAGDEQGPTVRRRTGRHCGRRPVAAADLPGNAVHQVAFQRPKNGDLSGSAPCSSPFFFVLAARIRCGA